MQNSLVLQLGGLLASLEYPGDVPNFLEPWYGIGTISSAFGSEYQWLPGQAPALRAEYSSVEEILRQKPVPVAETAIGRHTLEMIEFFMDKTRGQIPVSLTDSQSPLNMAGNLCPLDSFLMDIVMQPDQVRELLNLLADLSIEFNRKQVELIGDALASPGHGFASSREWVGLGMSDDNAIMISPAQYLDVAVPSVRKICNELGGPAFHSCGNWERWIEAVKNIEGLVMVDGAFSEQTDPAANHNLEAFQSFAHTGIVLNARVVGAPDVIEQKVRRLWTPGMKLVVVTYCKSPEDQREIYDRIHEICC
jgi:uroporphyrinogen-III decarboxylase